MDCLSLPYQSSHLLMFQFDNPFLQGSTQLRKIVHFFLPAISLLIKPMTMQLASESFSDLDILLPLHNQGFFLAHIKPWFAKGSPLWCQSVTQSSSIASLHCPQHSAPKASLCVHSCDSREWGNTDNNACICSTCRPDLETEHVTSVHILLAGSWSCDHSKQQGRPKK